MSPGQLQRGFTLLELMIAMAILGIISAVAFYTYDDQSRKSRRTDAVIALEMIAQAQQRFFTQNNTFTTSFVDLAGFGIESDSTTRGYYDLSMEPADGGIAVTVAVIATPTKAQAKDACTELRVLSNGTRNGKPDRATCWGK